MNELAVEEVSLSLWKTGLSEEILLEAVLRGEAARDSVTAHAPLGAAGYNAWQNAVTALRDLLVPKKWELKRDHNLETVVSPCGRHEILVVAGDRYTGSTDPRATPQPKRPRGEATEFAADRSQLSLDLGNALMAKRRNSQGPVLWMLLIHRVKGSIELRTEISLPGHLTDTGYVATWHHRHVLDITHLGPQPEPMKKGDNEPSESTVEVKRKS